MRLVVNIPTFNERENIEEIIKAVLSQAKKMPGIDLHVLVSDGHSPDGTGEIVKKLTKTNPKIHYLDVKERGLGIGIVKGHRWSVEKLKADILAQLDGDMSHDPSSLPIMVKHIFDGYDLVIGSRLTKGGKNLLGWHRRLFTSGSALYSKIAWGTFGISEYTNSYRVFTKQLFEKINFTKVPWKSKTYIIQPAFLYAAITAGAKIKEVPITFTDRKKGYSKAKIVSYILDVLRFGIKVRFEKSKTFIKFLMVGTLSYLVNAVALGLLNRGEIYSLKVLSAPILSSVPQMSDARQFLFLHLDRLLVSSLISIELSIMLNFILHDNWTFKNRAHDGSHRTRFLKFNLTSAGSPLIQLASIITLARIFHLHEQIGLALGVIVGLFFNYFINLIWVWKDEQNTTNDVAARASAKVK
ncbi:MAG: glycosyltransferase [Patescibacteria group bacterium]